MGAKYYEWKAGFPAKVSAAVAGQEIERIRDENGGTITPQLLVQCARDKENPLNPQIFDVSQKKAADRYYLANAYKLLRSITVEVKTSKGIMSQPVAYEVVSHAGTSAEKPVSAYTSIEDAMSDPVFREQVLARAIAELSACRKKYAMLSELSIVFAALDKVAASL